MPIRTEISKDVDIHLDDNGVEVRTMTFRFEDEVGNEAVFKMIVPEGLMDRYKARRSTDMMLATVRRLAYRIKKGT